MKCENCKERIKKEFEICPFCGISLKKEIEVQIPENDIYRKGFMDGVRFLKEFLEQNKEKIIVPEIKKISPLFPYYERKKKPNNNKQWDWKIDYTWYGDTSQKFGTSSKTYSWNTTKT